MFPKAIWAILLLFAVLLSFEHSSLFAVANAHPAALNEPMRQRGKRFSCTNDKCFKNCATDPKIEPENVKECASICDCTYSSGTSKGKPQ
uniref:Uncharacterized protein n=1 Tax=Globodera rostochiensis TaxID=31243 RepID=A0A914H1U5_GLORO